MTPAEKAVVKELVEAHKELQGFEAQHTDLYNLRSALRNFTSKCRDLAERAESLLAQEEGKKLLEIPPNGPSELKYERTGGFRIDP